MRPNRILACQTHLRNGLDPSISSRGEKWVEGAWNPPNALSSLEREWKQGACFAPPKTSGSTRRAFTLLEVMLAVFILGMVGLSIYRFLEVNLTAIRFSTEQMMEDRTMEALVKMLQAQMLSLPIAQANALRGEAYQFNGVPQDELEWLAGPGQGLVTEHASGDYRVTLALRLNEKSDQVELGLRRIVEGGNREELNWWPLMTGISAMELRYYDDRSSQWLERWLDSANRPTLIRVRLWRVDAPDTPHEFVLHLPARQFQAGDEQ